GCGGGSCSDMTGHGCWTCARGHDLTAGPIVPLRDGAVTDEGEVRTVQTVHTPPTDAATCDARALALELAGVRQGQCLDPVAVGVVLRPEEVAVRAVTASFAIRLDGQ